MVNLKDGKDNKMKTIGGKVSGEGIGRTRSQNVDESSDEHQATFSVLPGDTRELIYSLLAPSDIFVARRVCNEWASLIASPKFANGLLQRATSEYRPVLARLDVAAGPWTQFVAETQLQRNLACGAFAKLSGRAPHPITWAGWSMSGDEALVAHADGIWAVRRPNGLSATLEVLQRAGTGQPVQPELYYTYASNFPATSLLIMAAGNSDPTIPATLKHVSLSSGDSTSIDPPCQFSDSIFLNESGDRAIFAPADGQIAILSMAAPYSVQLGPDLSLGGTKWMLAPGSNDELWAGTADNWRNLVVGGTGIKNISPDQRPCLADSDNPTSHVFPLALHPRTGLLATRSYPRGDDVKVWNVRNPAQPPLELAGVSASVSQFDRDGSRLALACEDYSVRIYSLADPSRPMVLRGHKGSVRQIKFHPQYPYVLTSSSGDRRIRPWALSDGGREVATMQPSPSQPYGGIFNASGDCILATPLISYENSSLKPQREVFVYDFLRPVSGK